MAAADEFPPWHVAAPRPDVSKPAEDFFIRYCNMRREDVLPHIISVRDKAWKTLPYPCLGLYSFLRSSLKDRPGYPELLSRLSQPGATMLDIGTCFGQDIRLLVADGVPPSNIVGLDVTANFWNLSFELFKDEQTMNARFICTDFLETDHECEELRALHSNCDVINAAFFFHLFTEDNQKIAAKHVIDLSKVGTIIFGEQMGQSKAGTIMLADGPHYFHSVDSWYQFWQNASLKTNTKWEVECSWKEWSAEDKQEHSWIGSDVQFFIWTAKRVPG